MNFVEAAVTLLREASGPLHVEELCRRALERGLLDSPGTNPLRSFKGRLTTELKRGAESRVVRVEDDVWSLSQAARAEMEAASAAAAPEPQPEPIELIEVDEEEGEEEDEEEDELELEGELEVEEDEEDEEGEELEEEEAEAEEEGGEAGEAIAARQLTPEEQELAAIYGDETGTAEVRQLTEYRDELTADEDRPMVPEMTAERRRRDREDWKARRERLREERRKRREARQAREAGGAAAAPAGQAAAALALAEPVAEAPPEPPGGSLARRACEVLASIKGGQPVPVKQLAQMMRKRHLIDEDPEKVWRSLKAALLADNQRRAAAGLQPRVHYKGRDLFAYRPSANAELEAAEAALEAATARLRGATERALAARLADMPLATLEQVAYLYLTQTGWQEIEWIKRVDRSAYAIAREPGDGQPVLIGVRAGNQPVDRRGVGELRAGVTAKGLSRGLLLAPRELGPEARAELAKDGPPVAVMAGLPWAVSMVQAGVAVAQRLVPVAYLDTDLLDRLKEP